MNLKPALYIARQVIRRIPNVFKITICTHRVPDGDGSGTELKSKTFQLPTACPSCDKLEKRKSPSGLCHWHGESSETRTLSR
jgi:hypothetical protein